MQVSGREVNINKFDDGLLAREIMEQQSKRTNIFSENDEQQSNPHIDNIQKESTAVQETVGTGYIPKGLVVTCNCGQDIKPMGSGQQEYNGLKLSEDGSRDKTYSAGMALQDSKTY